MFPADYVHMKEIIRADATQIPVGDQITQPALQLYKTLSQVFAIQRCFLKKKKKSFLGFAHPNLINFLWFSSRLLGTQGQEATRRARRELGDRKRLSSCHRCWESSYEQMSFIQKGKASGACSASLPFMAGLEVCAVFIRSTINTILYI